MTLIEIGAIALFLLHIAATSVLAVNLLVSQNEIMRLEARHAQTIDRILSEREEYSTAITKIDNALKAVNPNLAE